MLQSAEFSTTPPVSASIANTTSHTQETSGTKDGVNKRSVSHRHNNHTLTPTTSNRALTVIERVSAKLRGKDFGKVPLTVPEQVQRLIDQATSHENLCQLWKGWAPFW